MPRRQVVIALAAYALAGCAGNGEGLDASGRPVGEGGDDDGPLVATFESIQAHVFTPLCTGCHAGATAPQGLRLDAASSYDLLVGVASNEAPGVQRVQPGDPDRSYLVQKLEGNAAVGARMPLGGPYLDQATIDVIRQWITDGAARTASATGSFALAQASPANGDTLPTSPRQLLVSFTRTLDTTRLDASAVHLAQVADADATTTRPLAFSMHAVTANPRALVIVPRAGLTRGRYVLQIDAVALADLDGRPLGTDAAAGRPSGVRIVFDVEGER